MSYIPQVSAGYVTLRAATTALSSAYDSSPTALKLQNWNQLELFFDLTLSTATDVRVKVEFASPQGDATPAASDWFQMGYADLASASSSGGSTVVPLNDLIWQITATKKINLPIQANYKWVRVSAKTTGGPGSTTLAIYATQGMA